MTETNAAPAAPTGALPPYGAPLNLAAAKRVMAAAEAEAVANGWAVVIAILDSGGSLLALHRLDQANLGAVDLAQRKASTAVRFRRPTKFYEDLMAGGAHRLLSIASEVIMLEGGLPLLVDGVVVGSIGVSGVQSSQDAQVASAGARAL